MESHSLLIANILVACMSPGSSNIQGWATGDNAEWNPGPPAPPNEGSLSKGPLGGWDDEAGGGWNTKGRFPTSEPPDSDEGWGLEDTIPGVPGQSYPNYDTIPKTKFDCRQQAHPGYYGDQEARCQVFHICQDDGRHDSFLCPVGTIFNQETFVCDWWFNVNCADTPFHFGRNEDLYKTPQRPKVGPSKGDRPARPWGEKGQGPSAAGPPSWGDQAGPKGGRTWSQSPGEGDSWDRRRGPGDRWGENDKGTGITGASPPAFGQGQAGPSRGSKGAARGSPDPWTGRGIQVPPLKGSGQIDSGPRTADRGISPGRDGSILPGQFPKTRKRGSGRPGKRKRVQVPSAKGSTPDRSFNRITRSSWNRGSVSVKGFQDTSRSDFWQDNRADNFPGTVGSEDIKGSGGWSGNELPGEGAEGTRNMVVPSVGGWRSNPGHDQRNNWGYFHQQFQNPDSSRNQGGWTQQWNRRGENSLPDEVLGSNSYENRQVPEYYYDY